jgi:FkbM family methyltransferase
VAKIFVDVGGYHGHCVLAAMDPIFSFDRIFCFEPASACIGILRRINDRRVVLIQACLADENGRATLFNPGTLASSIYEDAPVYGGTSSPQTVLTISAIDFLKAFTTGHDQIWIKLNCEGSECDILNSIIVGRHHQTIRNILIDYDALKIPSQNNRVAEIKRKVLEARIPYSLPEDVQYGMINSYGGVRNWLLVTNAIEGGFIRSIASVLYNIVLVLRRPELSGYHKMKILKSVPILAIFAKSRRRPSV